MSLVKWDPWREMEDLFDRYAKSFGALRPGTHEQMATGDWSPRVDIAKTEGAFVIKAELPDIRKEDVKVTVDKGIMTLKGERKQEKEESARSSTASSATTEASAAASPCPRAWMRPR